MVDRAWRVIAIMTPSDANFQTAPGAPLSIEAANLAQLQGKVEIRTRRDKRTTYMEIREVG